VYIYSVTISWSEPFSREGRYYCFAVPAKNIRLFSSFCCIISYLVIKQKCFTLKTIAEVRSIAVGSLKVYRIPLRVVKCFFYGPLCVLFMYFTLLHARLHPIFKSKIKCSTDFGVLKTPWGCTKLSAK